MKTYEETAQYILEVRNEHDKKIKRRKALAMRIIPAAAGICGAVVICFAAVKNYRKPIDTITDESVITGGSISIGTTVPYGTEEAVTTLISTEKTTAKTTTKTNVSATSITTTEKAAIVEQTYAKTTNAMTAAVTSAVYTTVTSAPRVTATTTVETVTSPVTTQEITTEPISTGGWNWNGNGDWNHGGFGGFGGGGDTEGGGYTEGDGTGGEAGSEYSSEEQWQQLPINERYCYAYIYRYDRVYTSLYMISPEYVGEWIDDADMLSGQMIAGEQMQCVAGVYSVNGITAAGAVAIKFMGNDGYYLYYNPNADLDIIIQTVPQA